MARCLQTSVLWIEHLHLSLEDAGLKTRHVNQASALRDGCCQAKDAIITMDPGIRTGAVLGIDVLLAC